MLLDHDSKAMAGFSGRDTPVRRRYVLSYLLWTRSTQVWADASVGTAHGSTCPASGVQWPRSSQSTPYINISSDADIPDDLRRVAQGSSKSDL
jgi:hypothetical protein